MNFSQLFKYTLNVIFSPNGKYFTLIKDTEIIIYDTKNINQLNTFKIIKGISDVQWSPDSSMLLIITSDKSKCEIKSLHNPQWECSLSDPWANIFFIKWVSDSKKIISTNDPNFRLTLWSWTGENEISFILHPKFNDDNCILFTNSGLFGIIPIRNECKDYWEIYEINSFTWIQRFWTVSHDFGKISLTYDDTSIILIDHPLSGKIFIYTLKGDLWKEIDPFDCYTLLNINDIVIDNNSIHVGFCCWDDNWWMIYDCIQWKKLVEFEIEKLLSVYNSNNRSFSVFKEEEVISKDENDKEIKGSVFKEISERTQINAVNCNKNNNQKGNGVQIKGVMFSHDSKYIAWKSNTVPYLLWIININENRVYCAFQLINKINNYKWSPGDDMWWITTCNSNLYCFNFDSIGVVEIPYPGFKAKQWKWNNNYSDSLLVFDDERKNVIVGYRM